MTGGALDHASASCALRARGQRCDGDRVRADRGRHVGRHHHRAFGTWLEAQHGPHDRARRARMSTFGRADERRPVFRWLLRAVVVSAPGEPLMSTLEIPALREIAESSNAWPFQEARKIVARLKKRPKDEVVFETGYGPSGLPHIGTFGEVARTTMVRPAFRVLTEDKIKTRLIAFSDDMDGLRKVPDNVPNKEMLASHLGKPLSRIPDPFSNEYPSFGAHNNARLRAFLDTFGFDYEFASSTDYYASGKFDAALLRMLERLDAVMKIMLPSLREERAATYSPFLPICPRTGAVLYVPIVEHDVKAGTVSYDDPETKERVTLP